MCLLNASSLHFTMGFLWRPKLRHLPREVFWCSCSLVGWELSAWPVIPVYSVLCIPGRLSEDILIQEDNILDVW